MRRDSAAGRGRARRSAWLAVLALAVAAAAAWGEGLGATDQQGVRLLRFTIHSRLLHRDLPATALVAPGVAAGPRPLVVFLHGKGAGGQDSNLYPEVFAALARLGSRAPIVVFPNGGEDSYWHDRAGGAWGSYVTREVIPAAVARLAADPRRVALGGISMGGFGALDIARLHPGRFCAVGAHSAALWTRAADTAPGAFDDAGDFARHDVIAAAARTRAYGGVPLWIDAGTLDPFRAADTRLAQTLRRRRLAVAFRVSPGGHDGAYWRSQWARYLGFYAGALARCR
ncbi:MAG: alpha/beta hydrolase [Solirubrobacteraceae bacterium]